jgi:hypothetical protein
MSRARRLLLISGLALAIIGMGYGLSYAVFTEHQSLDAIGVSLAQGFGAASEQNTALADSSMGKYKQAKYVYDRQVDAHGHLIGLAMLLLVLGIGFDRVEFSERLRFLLALALVCGAVLFPLGVYLQTLSHDSLPRAIAILGSALVIAALAGTALGVFRARASS